MKMGELRKEIAAIKDELSETRKQANKQRLFSSSANLLTHCPKKLWQSDEEVAEKAGNSAEYSTTRCMKLAARWSKRSLKKDQSAWVLFQTHRRYPKVNNSLTILVQCVSLTCF